MNTDKAYKQINNDFRYTIIGRGDSYKYSHGPMFKPGITNNNSYVEFRGIDENQTMIPQDAEIVFFGLQVFIKKYLSIRITKKHVDRAEKMAIAHGEPFSRKNWMEIVKKFDGYLPIVIHAVPEGTVAPPGVALVQVRAIDDSFAWLASFIETCILRGVWYPSTVATVSRECKKIIYKYAKLTVDDHENYAENGMLFKLHDFGARGVSSPESAELGGLAHLVNFMGTDTFESLFAAEDYYNADGPVGFSVPASEHSTITSWGKENEYDAFENMIDKFGGKGKIFSCVSDSYDIWKAIKEGWGGRLKEKVMNNGGMLVVRPDSGDPLTTPVKCIELLYEVFGGTVNNKGYKVLPDYIRVLQGDGINTKMIGQILSMLESLGYSSDNIAFGMGGALLQKVDRDTLKAAMKTNAVEVDGKWVDVYKQPIDEPFKKSKAGVLATVVINGVMTTIRQDELKKGQIDLLGKVWECGTLYRDMTFVEVRENAKL